MVSTLVGLTATVGDGAARTAAGGPVFPGLHVRWSTSAQLGFPHGGFDVYRRRYQSEVVEGSFGGLNFRGRAPSTGWRRIARLPNLGVQLRDGTPMAELRAVARGRAGWSRAGADHRIFDDEIDAAIDLLRRVADAPDAVAPGGDDPSAPARLDAFSALSLASMDPHIAAILGLAVLDPQTPPWEQVDYLVRARPGGMSWPRKEIGFHNVDRRRLAEGDVWVDGFRLTTARAPEVLESDGPVLRFTGAGALGVRIQPPTPGRLLILDIPLADAAVDAFDARLRLRARLEDGGDALLPSVGPPPRDAEADGPFVWREAARLHIFSRQRIAAVELFADPTDAPHVLPLRRASSGDGLGPVASRARELITFLGVRDPAPYPAPLRPTEPIRGSELFPVITPRPAGQARAAHIRVRQVSVRAARARLRRDGVAEAGRQDVVLRVASTAEPLDPEAPTRLDVALLDDSGAEASLTGPEVEAPVRWSRLAAYRFSDDPRGPFLSEPDPRAAIESLAAGGGGAGAARLSPFNAEDRRALRLDGLSAVRPEFDGAAFAGALGFRVFVRIRPETPAATGKRRMVLLDVGAGPLLRLELRFEPSAVAARVVATIAGSEIDTGLDVPFNRWSALTFDCDGARLVVWVDRDGGPSDSARYAADVAFSTDGARGEARIGGSSSMDRARSSSGFFGQIADLVFWLLAPHAADPSSDPRTGRPWLVAQWPFDGSPVERVSAREPVRRQRTPRFARSGVRPHGLRIRRGVVVTYAFDAGAGREGRGDGAVLDRIAEEMTVSCMVRATRRLARHHLLRGGGGPGFALGLELDRAPSGGDAYRIVFEVNGATFKSEPRIRSKRRLSERAAISVSYDGARVWFSVNGVAAGEALALEGGAPLGVVRFEGERQISIGPPPPETGHAVIADLTIWCAAARGGRSAALEVDTRFAGRAADAAAAPSFIDRGVPPTVDGAVRSYRLRGVDAFGRRSEVSVDATARLDGPMIPPAPATLQARYQPIVGEVTRLDDARQATMRFSDAADLPVEALTRHDVTLSRPDLGSARFELTGAVTRDGDALTATLSPGPRPRMIPQIGDAAHLEFDGLVRASWDWTGLQALFHPTVAGFTLASCFDRADRELIGVVAAVGEIEERYLVQVDVHLTDPPPPDRVGEAMCRIGAHAYAVESYAPGLGADGSVRIVARYAEAPLPTPAPGQRFRLRLPLAADGERPEPLWSAPRPLIDGDRAPGGAPGRVVASAAPILFDARSPIRFEPLSLGPPRARGVDWLPREQTVRLVAPSGAPPVASPEEFVPGALNVLVARTVPPPPVAGAPPQVEAEWRALSVLWAEAEGDGAVYFLGATDAGALAGEPVAVLRGRYYPGRRLTGRLAMNFVAPAAGDEGFAPERPTLPFRLSVSAVDADGRIGAPSAAAEVVARDQRRPETPPAPRIAAITPADYFGRSEVTIEWPASADPGVAHNLFFATDAAIIGTDLENRIGRFAPYDLLDPFADDPDVDAWLADMRWREGDGADLLAVTRAQLFEEAVAPSVRRAIWRAWAERFYPALTRAVFDEVAGRVGNEAAFTRVAAAPIRGARTTHEIDGRARNRLFYRLRSVAESGAQSIAYGPVGSGDDGRDRPPPVRPPRAPVFDGAEPGDRSVTLSWGLHADQNVAAYRLYRSWSRSDLEDLRWFAPSDAAGRVRFDAPDPRLRVQGRALVFPESMGPDMVEILGVFLAREAAKLERRGADPLERPGAHNLFAADPPEPSRFSPATDAAPARIEGLRLVADGARVVVYYRDAEGRTQRVARGAGGPPFVDAGLIGRRDHFYRLVAIGSGGAPSEPSEILAARPLEIAGPPPPNVTEIRRAPGEGGADRVALALEVDPLNAQVMAQRRALSDGQWRTVASWRPVTEATFEIEDTAVEPGVSYLYRVWGKSDAGSPSAAPPEHAALRLDLAESFAAEPPPLADVPEEPEEDRT